MSLEFSLSDAGNIPAKKVSAVSKKNLDFSLEEIIKEKKQKERDARKEKEDRRPRYPRHEYDRRDRYERRERDDRPRSSESHQRRQEARVEDDIKKIVKDEKKKEIKISIPNDIINQIMKHAKVSPADYELRVSAIPKRKEE